jgi:hypothetical protein
MNILKLALSGNMPLQFDNPANENGDNRPTDAINERLQSIEARIQIEDAFAWLLHII